MKIRAAGISSTMAIAMSLAGAARAQDAEPQLAAESQDEADAVTGDVIIVTAQKREERLIDVPIAITALSSEALDQHKIESGSELLRAVPNVNFSKSNFSMYNFSIRGIGTKAISAASDPAVAISFNNIPLIRNRLFESEFFDTQRIEVLRGPQGTLYGRNATSGVVNIIPAAPEFGEFSGEVRAEAGNYSTRRLGGHVNIPLGDTLAVRAAGMLTKRNGYDFNTVTNNRVNGRDLWSTRVSVGWEPSSNFSAGFIWQHFEEDDNRSRTGKALCTRDPGPEQIGDTPVQYQYLRSRLSQGCLPSSLYSDDAYAAPNLEGSSQILAAALGTIGRDPETGQSVTGLGLSTSPYGGIMQSRDLREIATSYDPVFRAKNDIFQLNLEFGMGDVALYSQTTYARDRYYSSQDYNRFVSVPIFPDSNGLVNPFTGAPAPNLTPGGVYTDPQLGPSNRLVAVDISQSRNDQWFQELRLTSSSDGPLNFNVGANYLNFDTQDDYYVLSNLFSYIAESLFNRRNDGIVDCSQPETVSGECVYVDPNPIDQINGAGHNYFRSKNVVETESWGFFGELYWDVTDNVKVTAGARYTTDRKTTTPIPTQLLLGAQNFGQDIGTISGGYISRGYRVFPDTVLKSDAFTGRLVVDWRPATSFTDDTLIYASASRGYKAGGTNPPPIDVDPDVIQLQNLPGTFDPEYVTSFEIGTKNSFDGGRFSLNATAFLNLYKDYQVSQIVDRIALNENFDLTTWGVELEAAWRPSRRFRADATLGFLQTRIGDGEQSIDVLNRTQGNEDWVLVRPSPAVPSNCIAPRELVETILGSFFNQSPDGGLAIQMLGALCGGSPRYGSFSPAVPSGLRYDLFLGIDPYNPLTDAPNGGRGFYADLSGNELPNAPHLTFNIGAQYTLPIDSGEWELTLRGDYYRQASSYARVYNTEIDRLRAWDNVNAVLTLARPEDRFSLQLYVKNVFNDAPITDYFLNSDDTGLTANVFTLDPRIIGLRATVGF